MRQPTPPQKAYEWYSAAMNALDLKLDLPPVHEDDPHPGWYQRRFEKGAIFVPARIWLIQTIADGELVEPEVMACEIGGERFDVYEVWTMLCSNPISKQRYDYMMNVRAWAVTWRKDQPEAQPTKPVDLFTVQPPQWGSKRNLAKCRSPKLSTNA